MKIINNLPQLLDIQKQLNNIYASFIELTDKRFSTSSYNLPLEQNSMYLLTANVNIDHAPNSAVVMLLATGEKEIRQFQLYCDFPAAMENKPFFPTSGTLLGIYPQGWSMFTSVIKLY